MTKNERLKTPGTKSARIRAEHHRLLKVKAARHGVPLQQFLDHVLELALSEHPVMKHLLDEHFRTIDLLRGS